MPTVTLKVSDVTRREWQDAADGECGGNISEWLRRAAEDRSLRYARNREATGAVVERTVAATRRPLPPERIQADVRPFRGPDTKTQPLRRT